MILVEDAPRLRDVDRPLGVGRPGQLQQPVEVGAHHRVLARALGHALEALQFLARLLLDLLGHRRFGDRLLELGDLGRALLVFAQLLADRAHLLAQHVLAVAVVDRLLGARVDVARHLEHLDAVRQQIEQLVLPRLEVEHLEQRLLLRGGNVHQAGDQVGELRGAFDARERRDELGGDLRQELQDLQRALLQVVRAPLDVRVVARGLGDELHARRHERIAVEELQDAKARHALAHGVVRAVGRGDVAQHGGRGADPVQVLGPRRVDFRLALQQDPERALQARGFVRGGARAVAAHGEREHHAREQHDVAHRHDDQRIVGQRARGARRGRHAGGDDGFGPVRRVGARRRVVDDRICAHATPDWLHLKSRSVRHPSINSRVAALEPDFAQRDAALEAAVGNLQPAHGAAALRRREGGAPRARPARPLRW